MSLPGHYLAKYLAWRGHQVAYLSAPVSPWHFLEKSSRDQARLRWSQFGFWGKWKASGLFVAIPKTLFPVHHRWPFNGEFAKIACRPLTFPPIRQVLKQTGFESPDVLRIQNLQMPGLADSLNPRYLVYSMEDDLEHFPRYPRNLLPEEKKIAGQADLVTVTAESLKERADGLGAKKVAVLPNGVATKLYRPRKVTMPPEGRPRAVYVGALDDWFDEELLAEVAGKLSHWDFQLIGPPRREFSKLRELSNVEFTGPIPPKEVPPYLWKATAGIIPFQRTPLIEAVRPLKLFEYLAAGLPVVSAKWREMELINSPALLANSAGEFCEFLEECRSKSSREKKNLVRYAVEHDWKQIFADFENRVISDLRSKGERR